MNYASKKSFRTGAFLVTFVLLFVASFLPLAQARGGMASEDRWAPAHIDGLPGEIRRSLVRWQRMCGVPAAAEHQFALYLESPDKRHQFIALHFEQFRCTDRTALCTKAGCLHQVYVSAGGTYRLVLSTHVSELELKIVGKAPAVEIACAQSPGGCLRTLIWRGSRFVE